MDRRLWGKFRPQTRMVQRFLHFVGHRKGSFDLPCDFTSNLSLALLRSVIQDDQAKYLLVTP